MRYIWETGRNRRVMHIQKFPPTGETMPIIALCKIGHRFNRSINAPWAFGRKICKRCEKIVYTHNTGLHRTEPAAGSGTVRGLVGRGD